jgi:peptidoglycan/LPS O-acetylase OafA/YrhL
MDQIRTRGATPIDPLTSLRFFAAIWVITFHSGYSFVRDSGKAPSPIVHLLSHGFNGVTFFFILSGFILQYIYRTSLGGRAATKKFYIARFARIYPVYLLSILLLVPPLTSIHWPGLWQFFLLQSWPPVGSLPMENWNLPAWTLSVEFFFYLLFPRLSGMLTRTPSRLTFGLIGTMWVASAVAALYLVPGDNGALPARILLPLPILHLPEFILGVAVGELEARGHALPKWSGPWIVGAIVAVILFCASQQIAAGLLTCLFTLLIWDLSSQRATTLYRLLSMRWLVLLGGASYAIYLLHQAVHAALGSVLNGNKLGLLLQYPLTLAFGIAVFLLYEEPMRRWIRLRLGSRPSLPPSTIAQDGLLPTEKG